MTIEESYLAGYQAALIYTTPDLFAIPIPPDYTARQRVDFAWGVLVGTRERRAAELREAMGVEQ